MCCWTCCGRRAQVGVSKLCVGPLTPATSWSASHSTKTISRLMQQLTFGSLFAGIGGFDLGFERAGLACKWQVEINEYATRVLEKHWPEVNRHRNVKDFPPGPAASWQVDCIIGGPPCQRTSLAAAIHGKRTGETLWPEMFRVVGEISPSWIVVEQPPAGKKWEQTVKGDLAAIGYHSSRLQLSAERRGAPHRRRRMFIVAHTVRERCEEVARLAGSSASQPGPWPAPPRGTWRTSGAGNRRVDDGFSDWMDRLTCLGNAVVPQMAEWIGRQIMEATTPAPAGQRGKEGMGG